MSVSLTELRKLNTLACLTDEPFRFLLSLDGKTLYTRAVSARWGDPMARPIDRDHALRRFAIMRHNARVQRVAINHHVAHATSKALQGE